MSCVKSLHVPNFLGFARYSHLTGFTEFTGFYIKDFSLSTHNFYLKAVLSTVSTRGLTNLQDYYTITFSLCKNNFFFDKKIKGWYLPSLKNITRKIYLVHISKLLPAPEANPATETALTRIYFVVLPAIVAAI